MLLKVCIII